MAFPTPFMPCENPAGTYDHTRPSPSPSPPPPPYSLCNAFSPKASLPRRLFDVGPHSHSHGDFLSVIRLLRELVDAFEECGRTTQEQKWLITEIRKLEQTIIQVEAHYGNIESPAQQMVLEHAAQACQKSIYDFVMDARQRRHDADAYCTDQTRRDDLADMRLDLVTEEDTNAFRHCISDHIQSIQTLLITIQVSSTGRACTQEETRPSSSPQAGQMNSMNYSLVLLNKSFATLRQALVDQGSVSQKTLANVDAIREITVMNNLQLLSALEQLQNSLPAQVLLKDPVIFTDALDRVAPIHLDWITSWDAFLAVLEVRFSDLGSSKIRRGEFALQESSTRGEVTFTRPIASCLKPGQHVDMSMIFRDRTGETKKNVCPHCHTICEGPTDTETICLFCGCQFRRVEEQDDQSEAIRDAMSLEHIMGQATPGTLRKRKRLIESITSDEVGPGDFKKVRLMCSQRQHHTRRTEDRPKLEQQHEVMQEAGLSMPWWSPNWELNSPDSSAPTLISQTSSQSCAGQNSLPDPAGSSLSASAYASYASHGLGSTDWNPTLGLQGEWPLSFDNFSRLAHQYDNSVLSKIGTVHDKAQPAEREATMTGHIVTDNFDDSRMGDVLSLQNNPSSSNTRYPRMPPSHPAPKFGNESSIEDIWQSLSPGSDQDTNIPTFGLRYVENPSLGSTQEDLNFWLDEFDSCSNEFDLQYQGRSSFPIWGVDERVSH